MSIIKNILFDFGDIFIDLDKAAPYRILSHNYPELLNNDFLRQLNEDYEVGNIESKDFINHYLKFLPSENPQYVKTMWNSIIGSIPSHRLKFIHQLAKNKQYKLILLSNTNALHIERVLENVSETTFNSFKSCFDKFYLSHEIHLRKPQPSIFEFVLEDSAIQAQESFFVDDTLEHIQAARKLGFHTWHLQPGKEDITELFTDNSPFYHCLP